MKNQRTLRFMIAGFVVVVASVILAAFPAGAQAQGKGNNGKVGGKVSGWIFCQVQIDDLSSGVASDGEGPYVDGELSTEMIIGRNFNIELNFNDRKNKPSQRWLTFNPLTAGFPVPASPASQGLCDPILSGGPFTTPDGSLGAGPAGALQALNATLTMSGQDHDDTLVGRTRHVNAVLSFTTSDGERWIVHFGCRLSGGGSSFAPSGSSMEVTRLGNNGDGNGVWTFHNGAGIGYVYRDNNPPHSPTEFWGTVTLKLSGEIVSLSEEAEPLPGEDNDPFPDETPPVCCSNP